MKCRLIRDCRCEPGEEFPGEWYCKACPARGKSAKLTECPECGSLRFYQKAGIQPAGYVLDRPEAYMLVQFGVAEPVDDECFVAAGRLTPAQLAEVQHASLRAERGIQPEDFDAYDAGEMVGYNPDGSWKEGPNYDERERERLEAKWIGES